MLLEVYGEISNSEKIDQDNRLAECVITSLNLNSNPFERPFEDTTDTPFGDLRLAASPEETVLALKIRGLDIDEVMPSNWRKQELSQYWQDFSRASE